MVRHSLMLMAKSKKPTMKTAACPRCWPLILTTGVGIGSQPASAGIVRSQGSSRPCKASQTLNSLSSGPPQWVYGVVGGGGGGGGFGRGSCYLKVLRFFLACLMHADCQASPAWHTGGPFTVQEGVGIH